MLLPSQERHHALNLGAIGVILLTGLTIGIAIQLTRGEWPFERDKPASEAAVPTAAVAPPRAAMTAPAPTPPDPERAIPAGQPLAPAEIRAQSRNAYAYGAVALDERRTAHVLAGVTGRVERLAVEMVGPAVKAGDTLCTLSTEGPDGAKTIEIKAPRAGFVVMKAATAGMAVEPSTELYTVADVSRMWILVDVQEADLPYVHVGSRARLTLARRRGTIDATIAYLDPSFDSRRRVKARLEIANRDRAIKPGVLVTAELPLALGSGLVVPDAAIARTDSRTLVFVAENGKLRPRDVVLGPESGKVVRVERGLAVGEQVAMGAQALFDGD